MSDFTPEEIDALYRIMAARRDMRHFLPDAVDPTLLNKILQAAHMGPSVGFMQPWRFIRITDKQLREKIQALVEEERIETAKELQERKDEFMRLKVEGINECGELLVVALSDHREEHIFGRRTLPEMDLASVACAIQNMWLASRAEGLGLGWVSLFSPSKLAALLNMPEGSKPVAILCIGHVEQFYEKPMLETENWAERLDLNDLVSENSWK
jgi:5,6-dimethylbenzimidazole synthase